MPSAYQPAGNSFTNPIRRPWAPGYLPTQMEQGYETQRQQASSGAAGGGGSSTGGMAGVANRIISDTEGRGQATLDDPYITAALARLSDIQSGKDMPFTDAVKSQMTARHGDMSSAAESANAEALRESTAANGGSMSDPSARAQLSQATQQRQAENLGYAGDLDSKATLANFDARNQATHDIVGTRLPQLGHADQEFALGAGYLNQTVSQGQHQQGFQYQPQAPQAWGGGGQSATTYQFDGGGSGSSTPSPWASSNGGSVWAGSGIPNPAPVSGGSQGAPTGGSRANPVFVNQDPYGGQGGPGYDFSWNPPAQNPTNPNRALIYAP